MIILSATGEVLNTRPATAMEQQAAAVSDAKGKKELSDLSPEEQKRLRDRDDQVFQDQMLTRAASRNASNAQAAESAVRRDRGVLALAADQAEAKRNLFKGVESSVTADVGGERITTDTTPRAPLGSKEVKNLADRAAALAEQFQLERADAIRLQRMASMASSSAEFEQGAAELLRNVQEKPEPNAFGHSP